MAITGDRPSYVVRSKLRPPQLPGPPVLFRRRVSDALGTSHRIVSVVAPTGFGKTVALSHWVAGLRHPVAWFSVDEIDQDPELFWTHLTNAVADAIATAEGDLLRSVANRGGVDPIGIATIISTLEHLDHPLTIVLDGVSASVPESATLGLSLLVQHLDGRVRFVFSGRSAPPLPFARWRAQGLAIEIDERDLALTVDETAVILSDPDDVDLRSSAQVHARVNGWPEGIGLVMSHAVAHEGRPSPVAPHLVDGIVAEHLDTVVLRPLPAPSRRVLGQMAHLGRFGEVLCTQLFGEGAIAAFEDLGDRHLHQTHVDGADSLDRQWTFGPSLQRAAARAGVGHGETDRTSTTAPGERMPGDRLDALTPRELTLVRLLPTHLTYAEMATELYLSVNTVKANLKSVYRKLGVASRSEAVARARDRDLLPR